MTTAERLQSILQSKAAIKAAIIAKGVSCDNVLSSFANRIAAIQGKLSVTDGLRFRGTITAANLSQMGFDSLTIGEQMFSEAIIDASGDISLSFPAVVATRQMFYSSTFKTGATLNVSCPANYDNNYSYMFSNCVCDKINLTLTKYQNPQDFNNVFNGCTANEINLTCTGNKMQRFTGTFAGCNALKKLHLETNIVADLDLSACTALETDSIVGVIAKLESNAGKTLTLGTTNLAKLTDAQKAVATAKGWTLK